MAQEITAITWKKVCIPPSSEMSLSRMGQQDIAYSTAGLEYSMNARIRGLEDQFRGSNAAPRVGVHRRQRHGASSAISYARPRRQRGSGGAHYWVFLELREDAAERVWKMLVAEVLQPEGSWKLVFEDGSVVDGGSKRDD